MLLSIILGLAITQVLQGFGQLLQGRERVRWHLAVSLGKETLSVLAMTIRRDWFHALAAVLAFAGIVAYIVLLFTRLQ